MAQLPDLYGILGVPRGAPDDEIKRRQDEQALLVSRAFSVPAIDFDLAVDRVASISGAPASVESAEAKTALELLRLQGWLGFVPSG